MNTLQMENLDYQSEGGIVSEDSKQMYTVGTY